MTKRLHDYVKYSFEELEAYAKSKSSCVHKVNTDMHMALSPYVLANFKYALKAQILRKKVGYYDNNLNGIILDVKNIKLIGSVGAMRADDCLIHTDINADCYLFRPVLGSILHGTVKHIGGNGNIGVVIYRVFNANIYLKTKQSKFIEIDHEIKFRLISFDITSIFPYIEGELLPTENVQDNNDINVEQQIDDIDLSNNIIIKEECIDEVNKQITYAKRKKSKNLK